MDSELKEEDGEDYALNSESYLEVGLVAFTQFKNDISLPLVNDL